MCTIYVVSTHTYGAPDFFIVSLVGFTHRAGAAASSSTPPPRIAFQLLNPNQGEQVLAAVVEVDINEKASPIFILGAQPPRL